MANDDEILGCPTDFSPVTKGDEQKLYTDVIFTDQHLTISLHINAIVQPINNFTFYFF